MAEHHTGLASLHLQSTKHCKFTAKTERRAALCEHESVDKQTPLVTFRLSVNRAKKGATYRAAVAFIFLLVKFP